MWQGLHALRRTRGAVSLFFVAAGCAACGTKEPSTTPTGPTGTSSTVTLNVALDAASVIGGAPVTATVMASGAIPPAGLSVALTSSDVSATVPTSVAIPAQGTSATFTVSTNQVATSTPVRISASTTAPAASASATLSVQPIPICGPFLSLQVAMPFAVYADDGDQRNHFIPSGFFGDTGDLTLSVDDRSSPHSGSTAVRIDYRPRGSQRFAGIFWQCPENNWGTNQDAGFNLSRARLVQFWARASAPAKAEFKVGGIGRTAPRAPFPDSFDSTSTSPVVVDLGTDWRQFTIDVGGRDLTRVIGGFMFVTNTTQNPSGVTVFLDDILWQ